MIYFSTFRNSRLQAFPDVTVQKFGILTTSHNYFLANRIQSELENYNFTVAILFRPPEDYDFDMYIVLSSNIFIEQLPPPRKRIIFQLEQSSSKRWFTKNYISALSESRIVLDYNRQNMNFLRTRFSTSQLLHLPISASLNHFPISAVVKKWDLLFYGCQSSPRRARMLAALKKQFSINVVSDVFGANLIPLIQQSRYVINIHYYENALLETARVYETLSFGIPIISEAADDANDYPDLKNAVTFFKKGSIQSMIETVELALKAQIPQERIFDIVSKSHHAFKSTFKQFLVTAHFIRANSTHNEVENEPNVP
jgi:hypothetical protein